MRTASSPAGSPIAALAAVAALAALAGCGGGGWVRDHPDVAERARREPAGFVAPAFARWEGLESLAGSYRMRVSKGIGRRSFDLAVVVRRPDLVDINVLDPTGGIQAFLRASPTEIGLYLAEDEVLYAGPATRDAFARALGFDLSAADAVAVLLGYGVERDGLPPGEPSWDADARRVRIDYGPLVRLWLHPVTMLFDRVEHRRPDARVQARLLEWLHVPDPAGGAGFAVPGRLELEVEPEGYGIRLSLSASPTPNLELPAGQFDILVPEGTLELPLEELARQGGLFRRTAGGDEQGG